MSKTQNRNEFEKKIIKAFDNAYRDAKYNKKELTKYILFKKYIEFNLTSKEREIQIEQIKSDYISFLNSYDINSNQNISTTKIFKKFVNFEENQSKTHSTNALKFTREIEVTPTTTVKKNEIVDFYKAWEINLNDGDNFGEMNVDKVTTAVMSYVNTYLWVDTIGRGILKNKKYNNLINKYSYANKLYGESAAYLYSPYFDNFTRFGNVAADIVSNSIKQKQDIIIFKIDIKEYYKSINMKYLINEVHQATEDYYNSINLELEELRKLNDIELAFHEEYSLDKGLVIGLESSRTLSEIYGTIIDRLILSTNPLKYARYVDDMIIVYNYNHGKDDLSDYCNTKRMTETVSKELDIELKIYKEVDIKTDELVATENKVITFTLNETKTKRFIITSDTPIEFGVAIGDLLKKSTSDAHLLPNSFEFNSLDIMSTEFLSSNDLATISLNLLEIKKILGLIKSRVYKIEKEFDVGKTQVYMGLTNEELKIKVVYIINSYIKTLNSINDILTEEFLIELMDYWQVFLYLDKVIEVYCCKKPLFNIKQKIEKIISKFENYIPDNELIYFNIGQFMKYWYQLSKYIIDQDNKIDYDLEYNSIYIQQLAKMNSTLNATNQGDIISELNKVNDPTKYKKITNQILNKYKSKKDDDMIHDTNIFSNDTKGIYNINFLLEQIPTSIINFESYNDFILKNYESKTKSFEYLHNNLLSTECDILIMPELYMKWDDLYDYAKFAKEKECVIISGLEYKVSNNTVLNMLVTMIPLSKKIENVLGEVEYEYKDVILNFRNKHHYSPEEKRIIEGCSLKGEKLKVPNSLKKDNQKIKTFTLNDYLSITSFNCFELYDINLRNNIEDKVSLVTAHEWNKDVEVFEKLSRSLLTDKKVFVAQTNYTNFGDIGLFQPKGNYQRDIIKTKGGLNMRHIRGQIDVKDLFEARTSVEYSEKNNYKPSPPGIIWKK